MCSRMGVFQLIARTSVQKEYRERAQKRHFCNLQGLEQRLRHVGKHPWTIKPIRQLAFLSIFMIYESSGARCAISESLPVS